MLQSEIDQLTRKATEAALNEIDKAIPGGKKSSGPLGDKLAYTIHNTISEAIADHLCVKGGYEVEES